ncbi:hypothetical protein H5410_029992 [Solanum commersonii]|uniref:Zinc finger PMZ-type domain-containing protein n=1 Tax=Solanum commersonii TaxID=4109 RepID=A0A9J5YHZ7_SOLCO|nr:hypothetical protein H5410_029992 [Solanum commersonii]
MAVTKFVIAGGDYMGVWEETPKSWNWKSFSKMTVPIALRRNGSYDDMIASVIEAAIGIDGSRPTLRINVNVRPPIEPTNSFNDDNDSIGNERLGDHSKESLGDNSNESLGDYSMNIHDDPTNVENQPVDVADPEPECCKKMQEQNELGSQSNHSFSDGTNLCINQTFSNKNELQLLLTEAAAKKSFDFAIVKSCTKYLKVKYAYSLEEFDNHFVEFKNKCPAATIVLEHDIGFEKWGRAYFPGNRYDVMTTNIAESLNAILIDKSIMWHLYLIRLLRGLENCLGRGMHISSNQWDDSLYVENATGDDNQFTMFGVGVTAYVDLLEKSFSYREYDLIKIPCAHAIAVLRSKRGNEYGMSIYEYSSPLYKVEAYLLAYMNSINIVPLESEWFVPEELLNVKILPPLVDTKLGRKRRKRVKDIGENF